ncbi:hypothetical protein EPUS_03813 [Endocarpon pusillum Z07020]|uniref:Uncharacterized protein n=1 Tax=Endocarpon pusillum (strain Z07020 / HMAS-L-300199) TaxID=1263415 RepID=U1HX47_ENDPU|nr:uncharacterized protein EPUS_03813 [Endocarpon pusillum Z07020]ERF73999.1 hypothetical protein EPUS_03813 [Endocarpon pusillum Z07020]
MAFDPKLPIEVYLALCVQRDENAPHWMLLLRSEGSMASTWYHSTGGPTQRTDYKVSIEAGKRFNSRGIASTEKLGTITPADVNKVKAAAQRIVPQQCQTYVVSVVAELENKGLLLPGNAARLNQNVRMGKAASDYRAKNPVPPPAIQGAAGPSTPPRGESPAPQQLGRSRTPSPAPRKTPSPPPKKTSSPLKK